MPTRKTPVQELTINHLFWLNIPNQTGSDSSAFRLELADFLADEFDGRYGIKTGYDLPDGLLIHTESGVVMGTPTGEGSLEVDVIFTAFHGSNIAESNVVQFDISTTIFITDSDGDRLTDSDGDLIYIEG